MREEEDLLTVAEVGEWLKLKPSSVHKMIQKGIFRKNVHFLSPKGISPRFIRAAIIRWLTENDKPRPLHTTYPLPDRNRETIKRA